jgi:hypothetical protein
MLLAALLVGGFPVHAQYGIQATEVATTSTVQPEWSDYNSSDPGRSDVNTQQGRVILDSDSNESNLGTTSFDSNATSSSPRGIEHEDIGVPSLRGTSGELEETQRNETDLEFLRERASDVSVSAVEVRGWDPKQKEALLETVRDSATVRTQDDLKHFAQGVLLQHERVERIETSTSSVTVTHRVPARLFGIFATRLEQEATIRFGDGEHGRVKVKFPWFRFLYRVDRRFSEGALEETLFPEVDDEVIVGFESGDVPPSMHASSIERLVEVVAE